MPTPTGYAQETSTLTGPVRAVSTSRTYNAGDLVLVMFGFDGNGAGTSFSITNSGTAQTWNLVSSQNALGGATMCAMAVWWCVMTVTQAMTITPAYDGYSGVLNTSTISVEKFTGQSQSAPVPAGSVFGTYGVQNPLRTITPNSTSSNVRMFVMDSNLSQSATARTSCTLRDYADVFSASGFTFCVVRSTTDPLATNAAFDIGVTDSLANDTVISLEIAGPGFIAGPTTGANTANQQLAQPAPLSGFVWEWPMPDLLPVPSPPFGIWGNKWRASVQWRGWDSGTGDIENWRLQGQARLVVTYKFDWLSPSPWVAAPRPQNVNNQTGSGPIG